MKRSVCPVIRVCQSQRLGMADYFAASLPAARSCRGIRQLAWTYYVFPLAMHTRFEHSLGVMHMTSMLYDGVRSYVLDFDVPQSELGYKGRGPHARHRRFSPACRASLHDLGHCPFSHAAEVAVPGSKRQRSAGALRARTVFRWRLSTVILQTSCRTTRLILTVGLLGRRRRLTYRRAHFAFLLVTFSGRDLISGQLDADPDGLLASRLSALSGFF